MMIFEKSKIYNNYIEVPENCNIYNFKKAKYYIDVSKFKNIELLILKQVINIFEKLYLKRNITNLINDKVKRKFNF